MSPGPHLVVAVYDIASNRRRYRVAKTLARFGVRVQKSAFECYLTPGRAARLRRELLRLIHPPEDDLRFYHLCRRCRQALDVPSGTKTAPPASSRII